MSDFYTIDQQVPLTYTRMLNGSPVTGLTVAVQVLNQRTNAVLLPSTNAPETAVGSGVYTYNWTHGLLQDTPCVVVYTVAGKQYRETILIMTGTPGGRAT